MTQFQEGSPREGLIFDSSEELYKGFTEQVSLYRRQLARKLSISYPRHTRTHEGGAALFFPRLMLASPFTRLITISPKQWACMQAVEETIRWTRNPQGWVRVPHCPSDSMVRVPPLPLNHWLECRPNPLCPWSNSHPEPLTLWSQSFPNCLLLRSESHPDPLAPWSESRPDPCLEFCFSIPVFNTLAMRVNSLLIFIPPVEEDG